MITVDSYVWLTKQELIKFVKSMDNGKGFFLDLSIALFSWRKGTGAVGHWLPLNAARVGVCSRLKERSTQTIFRCIHLEYNGGIHIIVAETRCLRD